MLVSRDYAVTPTKLLEVLTDQAFLDARGAKFGAKSPSTVQRDADAIVVVTPRQLALDQVPSAFRGFVGSGELVQTDTWSVGAGDPTGVWTTDVGGAPVKVGGTHRITATDAGCEYAVETTIKASIPFIGGAIESQVGGYLKALIGNEQEFAADWIASHA
ncbi:MAG: DUF2505 domain-containing protein [Actinomycetota bacterium]